MHDLLEFFTLRDTIPLVLLIGLLQFVGSQMAGNNSTVLWWARGCAAAGFLLFAGLGIEAWRPTRAGDFLALGVRALLAMGTIHGLARVTVPAICFLHLHLWATPLKNQRAWAEERARQAAAEKDAREKAERERVERERLAEEVRRRQEEIARRPPPPNREELVAAAKQRHESILRTLESAGLDETELRAAREKAKQQYLRELDEAMR